MVKGRDGRRIRITSVRATTRLTGRSLMLVREVPGSGVIGWSSTLAKPEKRVTHYATMKPMSEPNISADTTAWKRWWHDYRWVVLGAAVGFAVMNLIFLSPAFREGEVDPTAAGQLGDFVGGYVGTLFGLVSVILLYLTLRREIKANALQHFENRYFEMLKMHRDNVASVGLQGATGPKIFVLLIRELRQIHVVVTQVAAENEQNLTPGEAMHIAYYCLFFGTGRNSSRMLKRSLSGFDSAFVDALETRLDDPQLKKKAARERKFEYTPFEGHQSRLGHYYRHLYQTLRYIDQQPISAKAKYEYGKTVRAQLSTHEQALLLVNSLTPIGRNWWRHDLLTTYRMVQNVPQDFFDPNTELDMNALGLPPRYFEWEEVASAIK